MNNQPRLRAPGSVTGLVTLRNEHDSRLAAYDEAFRSDIARDASD